MILAVFYGVTVSWILYIGLQYGPAHALAIVLTLILCWIVGDYLDGN